MHSFRISLQEPRTITQGSSRIYPLRLLQSTTLATLDYLGSARHRIESVNYFARNGKPLSLGRRIEGLGVLRDRGILAGTAHIQKCCRAEGKTPFSRAQSAPA